MFGWIGSITGVIGAILVAFNFEFSKFGYFFFLVSSITWAIQANKNKDKALLSINLAFTIINIIGIYRWFF
jgi:nicotinamide riboside transporter PnuC